MPFAESARIQFENNPLVEVICQLRFPPILSIAAEEPATFQDRIRSTYPLYSLEEQSALPAEIVESLKNFPLKLGKQSDHRFTTENEKRIVTLNKAFLALMDFDYLRWTDFKNELDSVREAVEDTYEPSFYTRVGLRYRNAIVREDLGLEGTPWERLINPSLTGLLGVSDVCDYVTEAQGKTVIRLDEVEGGFVTLRQGLGMVDDRLAYLIDADFFTTTKQEAPNVPGILDIFNRLNGNLFRWAIRDELRDALQPLEISS